MAAEAAQTRRNAISPLDQKAAPSMNTAQSWVASFEGS